MYSDTDMQAGGSGRLLFGILVGAAVGVALGLAFAPYPGVETRRRLGESSHKFRKNAVRGYERASSNVSHLLDRSREALTRGQEAYERARSDARETLSAS
jgi:gas vesicle protein